MNNYLTEHEGKQLLAGAGVGVPKGQLAETVKEALAAAENIGYPVAMKVHSGLISHKSDVGGVITGLQDQSAAAGAFAKLMVIVKSHDPAGQILVEQMAPAGVEAIIGMHRDPQFGPVLMFGLGGVFTELLEDVSFRMIPVSAEDTAQMVEQIRGSRLLKGYRGMPPVDLQALQKVLLAVSELARSRPEISAVDLNPVLLYQDGAIALDCLIELATV